MNKCTCHKENGCSATTMWYNCSKHNTEYKKALELLNSKGGFNGKNSQCKM
jgi:hypothetical protein